MATVEAFPLPPATARTVPRTGNRAFGAPRTGHTHEGVDLFARAGTPVRSPVSGRVVASLDNAEASCGFGVVIRSDRDRVQWTLCHFAAMPLVERGEHVEAGEVVGVVGNTGNARNSGPHLHIHGRDNGVAFDPAEALVNALDRERAGIQLAPAAPSTTTRRRRRERASSTTTNAAPVVLGVLGFIVAARMLARRRRE